MKHRTLSGKVVANLLTRKFGFEFVRQRGSHIVLRRFESGRKITTVVPDHREVDRYTLKGVLELGEINEVEFWQNI